MAYPVAKLNASRWRAPYCRPNYVTTINSKMKSVLASFFIGSMSVMK